MEPQFKKEDVWAVAEYIADDYRRDNSNGPDYCAYCEASFHWNTKDADIRHKPDCLVLVARDLLTGKPK